MDAKAMHVASYFHNNTFNLYTALNTILKSHINEQAVATLGRSQQHLCTYVAIVYSISV